jgi:hypothetical protein
MRLIDQTDRGLAEIQLAVDDSPLNDWTVEVRLLERVGKAKLELGEHAVARVKRDWTLDGLRDGPKLVDAMAMIAMRVSDDYGVEAPDLCCQQLLPEIRSAIDQDAISRAFDEN